MTSPARGSAFSSSKGSAFVEQVQYNGGSRGVKRTRSERDREEPESKVTKTAAEALTLKLAETERQPKRSKLDTRSVTPILQATPSNGTPPTPPTNTFLGLNERALSQNGGLLTRSRSGNKAAKSSEQKKESKEVKKDEEKSLKPEKDLTKILQRLNRNLTSGEVKSEMQNTLNRAKKQHLNEEEKLDWNNINSIQLQDCGDVAFASTQGKRKEMEDAENADIIEIQFGDKVEKLSFFGIYDGHGRETCSKFIADNLHKYLKDGIEKALKEEDTDTAIYNFLSKIFIKIGEDYNKAYRSKNIGSTAQFIFKFLGKLYVVNCGDTRSIAISQKKIQVLTCDASPKYECYQQEALKLGGNFKPSDPKLPNSKDRIGSLAVASAVGHPLGSGINPRAEVAIFDLKDFDFEYIIMGCDGLWDVGTVKQVAEFVNDLATKKIPHLYIAHALVEKALQSKTTDNVSVAICLLSGSKEKSESKQNKPESKAAKKA